MSHPEQPRPPAGGLAGATLQPARRRGGHRQATATFYTALIVQDIRLRAGRFRRGTLVRLVSLPLVVELIRRGAAEPNDARTAEAVELALRLHPLRLQASA